MIQQHNILKITFSLLLMLTGMLPAAAQNVVLQESFDNLEGEGGNDKNWSGITPKPFVEDDIPEGWSISPAADGKETVRKGSKCVCIGATYDSGNLTDSGNAYLTTPTIAAPGTYMIYFKAGAWNASKDKLDMQITESVSGSVDIEQSSFSLTKGIFKDYSTKIVVKKANSSISFRNVYKRYNRFFIDEIKIVSVGSLEPINPNYVYKRATSFVEGKEYLIASEDSKGNLYLANPTTNNKDGLPLEGAAQTTLGTIVNETNTYDSYLIHFVVSNKKYMMQSVETSNYISTNSSNKFVYTERAASWTIDENPFGEDGRFIVKSNDRFLRMTEGNNTNDFRTYSSESYGRPIFLYEKVTTPPSGTIKISAKEGYGTFYSDKSIIMPEGLCGATVTDVEENGKLKYNWKYNAGDVVPAHTGLLLYASQPGSFDYYEATESTNAMQKVSGLDQTNDVVGGDGTQGGTQDETQEVNYLHGTTADETIAEDETLYKFYQLSYGTINGTRTIGFFFENAQGGVFLNKANKAYLSIPRNISAQSAFSLERNNPIMSITEQLQQTQGVRQIFDISGNRVLTTDHLQKGIYIVNGQKLMIR